MELLLEMFGKNERPECSVFCVQAIRMEKTNIYVLKLTSGKYYIGKSSKCDERIESHLDGNGSYWTSKYTPIGIEKIIKNVSPFEEDKITKEYMSKYGINNVRGGTYITEYLSETQTEHLKKEIWAANDLCTRCGRSGHFVKDCYAIKDTNGKQLDDEEEVVWCCDICDVEFNTEKECDIHQLRCNSKISNKCYRCGRAGHYANNCYARTKYNGRILSDSEDDYSSDY